MLEKQCSVCLLKKTEDAFYGQGRTACKECVKVRSRAWCLKNRDLVRQRAKAINATDEYVAKRKEYYYANREAIMAKNREKPKEQKQREARKQKLKKYGLTEQDYEHLLFEQGGVCKICGSATSQRTGDKYLYVDHDHVTGKVRGLLCHHCNAGIGHFKDQALLLVKAVAYLNE